MLHKGRTAITSMQWCLQLADTLDILCHHWLEEGSQPTSVVEVPHIVYKVASHLDPQPTLSPQMMNIIWMTMTLVTMTTSCIYQKMQVKLKRCLDVYLQTLLIRMFPEMAITSNDWGTKTMRSFNIMSMSYSLNCLCEYMPYIVLCWCSFTSHQIFFLFSFLLNLWENSNVKLFTNHYRLSDITNFLFLTFITLLLLSFSSCYSSGLSHAVPCTKGGECRQHNVVMP